MNLQTFSPISPEKPNCRVQEMQMHQQGFQMQCSNIASLVAIFILANGSHTNQLKANSSKPSGSVPEIKIVFDTANDAPTSFEPIIGSGIPYDENYFGKTAPTVIENSKAVYPPDEEAISTNVPYGNHLKPSNIA